jgi:heavy metal sensor kinase
VGAYQDLAQEVAGRANGALALLRQAQETGEPLTEAPGSPPSGATQRLRAQLDLVGDYLLVVDESGRTLYASPAVRRLDSANRAVLLVTGVGAALSAGSALLIDLGDDPVLVVARRDPQLAGIGRVIAASSAQEAELAPRELFRTAVVGLPFILLLSVGASYLIAGRTFRPVERIIDEVAAISDGRSLHRRLPVEEGEDELGRLTATLNAMLARLENAFDTLQRFTADAAHELRAPLAVMRSQVEVTLRQRRSLQQYEASHRALLHEIQRLSRIADQLLLLARVDAGALGKSFHDFDLPDLLEETVGRWRRVAKGQRVKLSADIPPDGRIEADPDLLGRMLDNLLDNAIRHAPAGGDVRLDASLAAGEWKILVSDSGPGVAREMRAHVFERFYRGDQVRGRENGGAGLGLSLSEAIVKLHSGSINVVDSERLRGACFAVRIPVKQPSGPGPNGRDMSRPYASSPTGDGPLDFISGTSTGA